MYKVRLETVTSNYNNGNFQKSEVLFEKGFEEKKEARKFFKQFAKENNLANTVYSNTKLGWFNNKQVELTTNF